MKDRLFLLNYEKYKHVYHHEPLLTITVSANVTHYFFIAPLSSCSDSGLLTEGLGWYKVQRSYHLPPDESLLSELALYPTRFDLPLATSRGLTYRDSRYQNINDAYSAPSLEVNTCEFCSP